MSIEEKWSEFTEEIKCKYRYLIRFPFQHEMELILKNNLVKLEAGRELYRARIYDKPLKELYWKSSDNNFFGEEHNGYGPIEMCRPQPEKTGNGRAHCHNIPVLYTATDVQTAIAEIRPWMSSEICVTTIKLLNELQLIDFTNISEENNNENELLKILNKEFSTPVKPEDNLSYLSTQYISEYIKSSGLDGIIFKSSLGDGKNVVFFNDIMMGFTRAKFVNTKKYEVTSINYSFIER